MADNKLITSVTVTLSATDITTTSTETDMPAGGSGAEGILYATG